MEYMWINLWNGKLTSYGRSWGDTDMDFDTYDQELELNIKHQKES